MESYGCITTRYLGPTNHHGARIVCESSGKTRVTVNYDHSASDAHLAGAAYCLARINEERAKLNCGLGKLKLGVRVLLPENNRAYCAFTLVAAE